MAAKPSGSPRAAPITPYRLAVHQVAITVGTIRKMPIDKIAANVSRISPPVTVHAAVAGRQSREARGYAITLMLSKVRPVRPPSAQIGAAVPVSKRKRCDLLATPERPNDRPAYRIVRFRRDAEQDSSIFPNSAEIVIRGLTLEQAQAHCQRDDSHGEDWFDVYEEEPG